MVTNTEWDMIPDAAVSIHTAETRTGVLTLPVDTCFVLRALRVHNTFWSTIWGTSNHLWQTSAVTSRAKVFWRIGVWPTGIWDTGVFYYGWKGLRYQ